MLRKIYLKILKRFYKNIGKPQVSHRFGAWWMLYPNDWIDIKLLTKTLYEHEQIKFASQCIDKHGATHFFDCGANIGLYSVILGLKNSRLEKIHAFEPVTSTWSRLVTNVSLNELLSLVETHNWGLSDCHDCVEIAINPKSTGTATLDHSEWSNAKRNFIKKQDITLHSFDEKFLDKGTRAFFKIDVEGHESQLLDGMKQYLQNNNCTLQIEIWPENESSITKKLEQPNYFKFHRIDKDFYFEKSG